MDPIAASVAPHLYVYGPLGIMCFVLGVLALRVMGELNAEKLARLNDAKENAKEIERLRTAHAAELAEERSERLADVQRFSGLSLDIQAKSLDAAEKLRLAVDKVVEAADTIAGGNGSRRSRS